MKFDRLRCYLRAKKKGVEVMTNKYLYFALVALVAACTTVPASAATWEVSSVEALTNAVKNAQDNDVIRLMKSGSPYRFSVGHMGKGGYGNVADFMLLIAKNNITIEGEDATSRDTWTIGSEPVVLDGEGLGGLVSVAGQKNCTLKNLTFANGFQGANYTAAVYSDNGSDWRNRYGYLVCTNCVFRGNDATAANGYSGVFVATLRDCLFTNNLNKAAIRGCYAYGCDFLDNPGKAISLSRAYDSHFEANTNGVGDFQQGGIISNCVFKANSIAGGTNLMAYVECAIDCRFEGNSARSILDGAGLTLACTNCVFTNNSASTSTVLSPDSLFKCDFVGNTGVGPGGAVRISSTSKNVRIEKCVFKCNNTSGTYYSGGAIYMARTAANQCTLVVTNCHFEGNATVYSSPNNGGAICNADGLNGNMNPSFPAGETLWDCCLVVDCTFKTNISCNAAGVYGVHAVNCTFDRNLKYHIDYDYHLGNAARVSYLQNCDFNEGYFYGCVLDRCRIHDVPMTSMPMFRDYTRATNCLVEKCFMRANGYLYSAGADKGFDGEFVNCTFVENQANIFAGYTTAARTNGLLFANCLFNGNSNGYYKTDFEMYLHSKEATNGFEYVTFQNVYVGKLDVRGVPKDDFTAKTNAPGTMSVCVDPKFAGRDSKTMVRYPFEPYWALSLKSPLLGKGGVADWMADATDLAGRPRLRDGKVDVGCYECWLNPPGFTIDFK